MSMLPDFQHLSLTISAWGLAIVACALAWVVVAAVRVLAHRWALLDVPNDRSSHATPTPRLGGLGIVAGVVIGLIGASLRLPSVAWPLRVLGAVALLVAAISLIDDLRSLPARTRFLVHLLAGVTVLVWIGSFDGLAIGSLHVPLGLAGAVVTLIWIAGFLNAFNFMDGIDGIAAGQAAIAGLAWAAIGGRLGEPVLVLVGLVVAGASLGFLWHNWPPATIFMGDVGSAFLGLLLASLPLLGAQPARLALPALLIVWPFVFDTSFTLIRRARRGERLTAAHRSHLYQRLVQAGRSHRHVTTMYLALAALGGVMAWLTIEAGVPGAIAAIAYLIGSSAALWSVVAGRERALARGTTGADRVGVAEG